MMCSLNIGIDGVNKALLGWDGACVGADTDATNWYNLADGSCKRVKLLNEEATAWNILAQLCDIIREAKAGNLKEIYITFSGHTGQINEELRSNDPDADAKDELWCVYDSYLPDWLLEAFLREIPVGGGLRFLLVDGSSGRVYRYRDSRIVQNVRIAVHGDGKRGDT